MCYIYEYIQKIRLYFKSRDIYTYKVQKYEKYIFRNEERHYFIFR